MTAEAVTFDDGIGVDDLADGLGDPDVDTEAPYGRRPDGTPYKKPKEERDRLAAQMAAGRDRARAEGRTPRTAQRTSRAPSRPAPRKRAAAPPQLSPAKTAVLGLAQMVSAGLTAATRVTPPQLANVIQADAIAVHLYAEPAAQVVEDLAANSPRLAAFIERVANAGPYGAAVMVAVPFVLQLAANHGLMPPIPAMGVLDQEQLFAQVGMRPQEVPSGEPAGHAEG